MGEHRPEAGILRGAGINAEADLPGAFKQMADAHLLKMNAVLGALDAVVGFPAAEAVPHGFDGGGNVGGGPVGIAPVGHHAAQTLKFFVFILNGALQPVVAVQVHRHTALVKPVVAGGKIRFHYKGEEFLLRFHLQHRRIVVAEAVVGPLPQVRMGLSGHGDLRFGHPVISGRSGPDQSGSIKHRKILLCFFAIVAPNTFFCKGCKND